MEAKVEKNFLDLPDDILIFLLKNYLDPRSLISMSKVCKKIFNVINSFDLYSIYCNKLPIIDYNYPYGKNLTI